MIERLAVLAEATPRIGTGHVVEAYAVARAALAAGIEAGLWLNEGTPGDLLAQAPCRPTLVESFEPPVCESIAAALVRGGCQAVLVNFRQIENAQVLALHPRGGRVVCVDEGPGRRLDCHAVINSSITGTPHPYSSLHAEFRLYAGAAYLALGEAFRQVRARARTHRDAIARVAVSCGGVDRSGTTLKVTEALLGWRPEIERHVVLGAGFAWRRELAGVLAAHPGARVIIRENLPSLAELFAASDVAFTAGGNTLYELACVGTPAVILYEDPHEGEAGRAFEAQGFGRCLGQAASVGEKAILGALESFEEPENRQRHCESGRQVVDGRGATRILEILNAIVSHDSAVTA